MATIVSFWWDSYVFDCRTYCGLSIRMQENSHTLNNYMLKIDHILRIWYKKKQILFILYD